MDDFKLLVRKIVHEELQQIGLTEEKRNSLTAIETLKISVAIREIKTIVEGLENEFAEIESLKRELDSLERHLGITE
ncbi:hypothetical protein [Alicyclobacillus fodiniaquatilis]|uniref:Uncharacterized protein n=1 Tax=Alicyclobacillus fodiniaquatilis TaxID=1661150 RepID=A0ABW4JEJ7_9BACL